jgi:DNA-binding MarR family transcriptional regulator
MEEKLEALCNLRALSRSMEYELGLDDLGQVELDILLAAQSLNPPPNGVVTSNDMRQHKLVAGFPPATFHRALRSLIDRGYLKKAEGAKAKSYILVLNAL